MILLGGEINWNIFDQGKPIKFLIQIKNPILLMPTVGLEPTSHSVVMFIPRLANFLNHSATEDWYHI